ncbi:hypothetical protein TrRE_jg12734 [Triparma retinervis]|uniref:Uncharacterized protein n=1 Tax=Triparma retinervis TaxID=2557542 RepID=A0A9W7DUF2_9STRA|nr:hypothetical protein TrRE_jg12734 [Triparma retinervis]
MSSTPPAPPPTGKVAITNTDIKSLIIEKEEELQSLTNYRLDSLQSLLSQKTSHLTSVMSQFNKLREDFEYNVKVVEGRDRELKRYEDYVGALERKVEEAAEEVRRLEVLRGEDLDRARKETLGVKEEVDFWRSKFDSMVKESDEARFKFERERDSMLRDMEEARREQQRTAREREEDMEAQRREVTGTFDEVLRVREMEGRRREEELKNSLRETESRLSDAMGQVELCRGREVDLRALAERDRASAEEAERALRQTRWACEDQIRVNDGKLMEKERLLEETKKVKDEMTEEYERKMGELLGSLHEVEKAFVEQRAKHTAEAAKLNQLKDETVRKQREKLEGVIEALTNKVSQGEARNEMMENQWQDDRKDFEGKIRSIQDRSREEAAEMLRKLTKAEEEARDAKSRAFTAETERNNEADRIKEMAVKERELQVMVEGLRTELAKADGGVEEARRLSKDRLGAMQREHERVIEKMDDEREKEGREIKGQLDRVQAEKRAMEDKVRQGEDEASRLRAELHGTKMRMRFNEGTAAIDGDAGAFGVLNQQPSPMFSDDMGPATPLVIESMGEGSAFGRDAEIERENRKLKDMVGMMRKEMEGLTAELMSPQGGEGGGVSKRAVEALEQQLVHAREYVVVLQGGKKEGGEEAMLRRHVKELTATIDDLRFENERYNKNVKSLRNQVLELERQIAISDEASSRGKMPSHKTVEAEIKVRELEDKLGETNLELKAIVGDRDRLLDLSNKLRVDMMRASPKKEAPRYEDEMELRSANHDPASKQLAEVIRMSEAKVAAKYESKIADIESSLRNLSEHNRMVRTEVDKWGGATMDGMHVPGMRIGGLDEDERNGSLMEARRALLAAKEDLVGIGGGGGGGAGWGDFASGVPLDNLGMGGGSEGMGYSRPPMLRSGGGYSSSVMTDSQREAKERLARSQRRRIELLNERRKVRNWNVKDDCEED